MAQFPHKAVRITSGQITATASPKPLIGDGSRNTNRILLTAQESIGGISYVGGAGVSITSGALIPISSYIELWMHDPGAVFVVGDQVVYYLLEEPEGVQ